MDLTTVEQDTKQYQRPQPTRNDMLGKGMPSRKLSKSLDEFNTKIAKYELISLSIIEKLRKILRIGFSESLLTDYEFTVSALTLLRLNIMPRNNKHLIKLYKKYSIFQQKAN